MSVCSLTWLCSPMKWCPANRCCCLITDCVFVVRLRYASYHEIWVGVSRNLLVLPCDALLHCSPAELGFRLLIDCTDVLSKFNCFRQDRIIVSCCTALASIRNYIMIGPPKQLFTHLVKQYLVFATARCSGLSIAPTTVGEVWTAQPLISVSREVELIPANYCSNRVCTSTSNYIAWQYI